MSEIDVPADVHAALRVLLGAEPRVARLGGLSGSVVLRASGTAGSVVVKRPGSAAEPWVYQQLAPRLREQDIALPQLHAALAAGGATWLLLEDVPHPLPRERWLADPAQLALLARLHATPPALLDGMPGRYLPGWDDALTDGALALLSDDSGLVARLAVLQQEAAPLFLPRAVVSGDPNPANWGLRADGSLVLFDWERLTLAHPALDLAIALPGLPSRADAALAVARYAAITGTAVSTRDLLVAKAWTCVELLAGIATSGEPHPPVVDWLVEAFPRWLIAVVLD